ncbi:hypothetical protein Taro_040607 [Colocasia esculenta]|uniref:Peptidase metallopeptidase domain-containing protein n=1 Tax=Colocasia esculenta TaxID=4460 RepID=A0A843WV19_COLES|nr:hypothetical protein [Colocasia esculenta]
MRSPSGILTLLCFSSALLFLVPLLASAHPFGYHDEGNPENPWDRFYNLSGCHRGDDRPGLADVKRYLHRFGYLPDLPSNFSGDFDDALEAALLAYQRNFHLNASGALDSSTVDLMVQPRCGVADVEVNGTATARGRGLYSYFSGRPTWPRSNNHLTYTFTSTSGIAASSSAIRAVFARAFSRWSAVTTLTFSEAAIPLMADITIGFYGGDHGDGEPFDGVLGTLAHAFSPPDGRFHLDAAENWVAEGDVAAAESLSAVDLESVAVHEIGHLLGLGHSTVPEAIMYPTIRAGTRKVDLSQDDVDGIQSLYGTNPSFTGLAMSPGSSTSPTNTMRERETNGGSAAPAGWAPAIARLVVAVGASLLVW